MNTILFGFKGKGFTIMAVDTTLSRSVIKILHEDNKFYTIWDKVSIGYTGDQGDAHQVLSFAREKIKFESLRNKIPVVSEIVANIIQKRIYSSLRSSPCNVGCLVGDKDSLFAVDTYGAVWEADYACMGYSQYFLYGILDKDWNNRMDIDEGINMAMKCINALKDKFLLGSVKYGIRVIGDEGIKEHAIDLG